MTIKDFCSFLLSLEPAKDTARLSFYHYLKNFCRLDEPLSASVLWSFYQRALMFAQWQSPVEKSRLVHVVRSDIEAFHKHFELPAEVVQFRHGNEFQWLDIEILADFEKLLYERVAERKTAGDRVKTLPLNEREALMISVAAAGSIVVEVWSRKAVLINQRLELAAPMTRLIYNQDLELFEGVAQVFQVSALKAVRFQLQGDVASGHVMQGGTFNRTDSFAGSLDTVPDLFWPLKSLEKLFINPVTDPSYLRVIGELEAALNALKTYHPERRLIAENVLRKAKLFQERVFTNDKVLNGLISSLVFQSRHDVTHTSKTSSENTLK
jgi:hypothetical protein